MTFLRTRPSVFNELHQLLHQQLSSDGDLSSAATSAFVPAVDIKEEERQYTIFVDVPGVDPKNIQISMEQGVLTLQGEKTTEHKTEKENFSRVERVSGSFYRRFTLPDIADAQGISAKSKHGVLEVTIPKATLSKPRKIEVQVTE